MRTGQTLTIFWKLETACPPPENLEQAPPPGSDQTHPPPVNRMNDRRLWKYYLGQNFVSAGKNITLATTSLQPVKILNLSKNARQMTLKSGVGIFWSA